jgi:hypothetical protein
MAAVTTMATMAHATAVSAHSRPSPTGEPEGAMPHRPRTASADVSGAPAMNAAAFSVGAAAALAMDGLSILRM